MNKPLKLLVLLSILIISTFLINATQSDSDNFKDNTTLNEPKNTSELYEIKALKTPSYLDFAGERVPLEITDVKERVDRELLVNTYWQSNGLLLFKRANKYFPVIEPILKEHGIPNDFKYLAVIESGLQNVTSPAGAKGIWQIMKETARENGLEVNDNVDERYHLEKATVVACDYLNKAKERFGTWTLAAAAYNAGNAGIADKLETQMVTDYYDLLVGDETSRYVPRIVAVKEILTHPRKYGFLFEQDDLYNHEPANLIEVDTAITNIALFAKRFNLNYKELKRHNPWLRENNLNNKSRKQYYIKIPVGN